MKKQKVYEITDKNYKKFYVRGLKNDSEAKKLGKRVFKKHFFDISYYDNYPSERTNWKTGSMTKAQFIKRYSWRYK